MKRKKMSMLLLGAIGLALGAFAMKEKIDAGIATNQRFLPSNDDMRISASPVGNSLAAEPSTTESDGMSDKEFDAFVRRELNLKPNEKWRCIDGMMFKVLPNGWENVPGASCEQRTKAGVRRSFDEN